MSEPLPEAAKAWLDGRSFPVVATIDPGGRPQQSIVWAKRFGDEVVFSTLSDRRKGRDLVRDPRIELLIVNPEDPYEYVEIRGTAEVGADPGGALINELGRKYNGTDFDESAERTARRVVVRVVAERVTTYGI